MTALIEQFLRTAASGLKSDQAEVDKLLRLLGAEPYLMIEDQVPCPRLAGFNPDPPVPGQPLTVSFYYNMEGFEYCVSITDATDGGKAYGPWCVTPNGSANPVSVTIPAQAVPFYPPGATAAENVVKADHDYAVYIYGSLFGIPFGCVQRYFATTSDSVLKQLLFAALNTRSLFPFGQPSALDKK
jgi:hypothetical protein